MNVWQYRRTVAEVCGTWCIPKKMPARCFLLVLEKVTWTSIFGKVYLFSYMVVCDFSEGAFGEIFASIRCPKTSLIHNIFS